MPVSCCAVNCTNRFAKGSLVKFFVFPADPERRKRWIVAVSRDKWLPSKYDRLCSAHFVSGRPSTVPDDVDYVPSVFTDGKKRRSGTSGESMRCGRAKKRLKVREEREAMLSAAEVLLDLSASSTCLPTAKDASTQTDLSYTDIESLVDECNKLKASELRLNEVVDDLKSKVKERKSNLQLIQGDDAKTRFYTGLPTFAVFMALLKFMEPYIAVARQRVSDPSNSLKGRKKCLSPGEELFAVLMRMRLGLLGEDVADRFCVSVSLFSVISKTWINVLFIKLKEVFPWPSRDMVMARTPLQFRKYPNTRVIIDCTELYIQRPTSLQGQSETFSHYKHHNTFKALVGISPGGVITFVSELWGGRVSDVLITERCGILDLIEKGDNVMADRGFDIADLLSRKGVTLNIPPFLGHRKQLTAFEVEETRRIAELRIHVERAIGRAKNYRILSNIIPISLAGVASEMFSVCCYLTNFLPPVVNASGQYT